MQDNTGGLDGLGILNFKDPDYFKKLIEDIKGAMGALSAAGTEINKTFGQTRQRIVEIQTAVADAVPEITRLGGGIKETVETIEDAALGARRNVLITTEQTEKLFAASKVTGVSVKSLVDGFADVGVGISRIPKQLEDSLSYIRSIGGNTKQVFGDVANNMDQLNRYQFEGGVQGLTKMAAQASMLRFNMNETFRLAEKVLTPEGAIETAAAFQRLGVSAGNLVDPFQLMNESINDPQGLQNSLKDVAKQFTYFDEQTKTFKINPQGVLTLKALQDQTGVNAAEMSKLGLAAAEADQRISAIKGIGLNLSEEDNQLLANISRMGEGGEYEIKVKQGDKEYYEKLSNISQQQLDATLKEQKEGPKTLEELQRAQLTTTDVIKNDLNAIKNKVVYGVVSPQQVLRGFEGAREGISTVTGELSKSFTAKDVRGFTSDIFKSFEDLLGDLKSGKKDTNIALAEVLEKLQGRLDETKSGIASGMKKTGSNIANKLSEKNLLSNEVKAFLKQLNIDPTSLETKNVAKAEQINSLLYGRDGLNNQLKATTKENVSYTATKSDVDVSGQIKIDVSLSDNFKQLDKEQQQKVLDEIFNNPQFQQFVVNNSTPQNSTKAPIKTTYGH